MSRQVRQNALDGLFACKQGVFWIEPYLQLGGDGTGKSFEIVWFSPFGKKFWRAERRRAPGDCWENLDIERVSVVTLPRTSIGFKQLVARLPVEADCPAQEYRLLVNGSEVFHSGYKSPSSRMVVFGDYADGRKGAADTARAIMGFDPSLLVIPGDVVYDHGRLSEYWRYYFPALNDSLDAGFSDVLDGHAHDGGANTYIPGAIRNGAIGAPLLRSRVSVAALGNHDIGLVKTAMLEPINLNCGKKAQTVEFDPERYDDLFAYFHIFRHPRNGPNLPFRLVKPGIVNHVSANKLRLRFGEDFLRRTNFSFDWLNTHWLVIDANRYMNWTLPRLRAWLRADLKAARRADWKFVVFHQPGVNSDIKYWNEQRMRLVFDILQEEKVDLTFSGHCHYYERHRPLRFRSTVKQAAADGTVDGVMTIDYNYDGITNLRPQGVIGLVTGAGGQIVSEMYKRDNMKLAESSIKLIEDRRSFTVLDVDGKVLTVRQVADSGDEIDRFLIDKR